MARAISPLRSRRCSFAGDVAVGVRVLLGVVDVLLEQDLVDDVVGVDVLALDVDGAGHLHERLRARSGRGRARRRRPRPSSPSTSAPRACRWRRTAASNARYRQSDGRIHPAPPRLVVAGGLHRAGERHEVGDRRHRSEREAAAVRPEHTGRQQHPRTRAHLGVVGREQQVLRRGRAPSARYPPTRRARRPSHAGPCAAAGRTSSGPTRAVRSAHCRGRGRRRGASRPPRAPISPRRREERDTLRAGGGGDVELLRRLLHRADAHVDDRRGAARERPHRLHLPAHHRHDLERGHERRVGRVRRGRRTPARRHAARRGPCRGSARRDRAGAAPPGAGRGRPARGGGPGPPDTSAIAVQASDHDEHGERRSTAPAATGGGADAAAAAPARRTSPMNRTGPPVGSRRAAGRT